LGRVESAVLFLVFVESCRTDWDSDEVSHAALLSVSELLETIGKGHLSPQSQLFSEQSR